jgi:hypothetical protein
LEIWKIDFMTWHHIFFEFPTCPLWDFEESPVWCNEEIDDLATTGQDRQPGGLPL